MLQANRFKDKTRGKKRALASKIQRLILSSVNSVEDIPDLLHYVFSPSFNYGLHHKQKIMLKNQLLYQTFPLL